MISQSFLFWFFLGGIIIASLQDLKRREVDNWLNFLLLVSGVVFILYKAFFEKDFSLILRLVVVLAVMYFAMNLFYYGRVFAGGDAKLLFGLSALFVGATYRISFVNIGIFLFLLMFSGSIYGLFYSFVLYFKNFKKSNKEIRKIFGELKFIKFIFYIGIAIVLFGILLFIYFDFIYLLFLSGIVLLFPILFLFSKALEKVCMIRAVSGKDLREGDWIVRDINIAGKKIKSSWEGLSEKDLKLLENQRRVVIKDGLPFVPAFLIALLLYEFFREFIFLILNIF